jgi:hypothetical protein
VSIGPEHGTVSPQQVQAAAKEAVRGVGFDVLVVCGFAFDPHVSEEVKRYGKLTVLPARMNPDLAMGDELLKKTGAGNLFMVFGEPDLAVHRSNGKIEVEIKGLDVYDPTTGAIRSSSTDDIALLVRGHGLQRRVVLCAPRLLHGRGQTVRQAETSAAGRHRRGRVGIALLDQEPPFRRPEHGQDRGQSDQPLRRRNPEVYEL